MSEFNHPLIALTVIIGMILVWKFGLWIIQYIIGEVWRPRGKKRA